MTRPLFIITLVALAACQEPFVGSAPIDPTLSARDLWSGGELRLTSAAFAPPAHAIVTLGADTLTLRSADDTTLVAQLPRRAGTFPLRVIVGRIAEPLGNVTLHGFKDGHSGPLMSGQPYWLPGGVPQVFAGADPGAAVFDLQSDRPVLAIPDSLYSSDCTMSVGPSYRRDVFVLEGKDSAGRCHGPKLWRISSHPELIDTFPQGSSEWYTMGQPAAQRWVFNWNNHNHFWDCSTGTCTPTYFNSGDGPNGITISPRADRFLWLPADAVTVFDAQTLQPAFTLPGFWHAGGSAFSFDGDTLFLVVRDMTDRIHLLAVGAGDGTVLRDLSLEFVAPGATYVFPGDVALDPVHPWLYAVMAFWEDTVSVPAMVVVDRSSWTVLGVSEVRGEVPLMHIASLGTEPVGASRLRREHGAGL